MVGLAHLPLICGSKSIACSATHSSISTLILRPIQTGRDGMLTRYDSSVRLEGFTLYLPSILVDVVTLCEVPALIHAVGSLHGC